MRFQLFIFLFINFSIRLIAQDQNDSTYYSKYQEKLLLRLYTVTKFNTLSIVNAETESRLDLYPNGQTNLGFGFNYKGFGMGIALGLPKTRGSQEKYGQTQRFDIQGSIYGNKIGGDGFFQVYQGYYNANPDDFVEWNSENFPQIPSMRILSVGIVGFYFFNNEKFSYRAAFVRDQIQNKSAGSFTLGLFSNYDDSETESGFIPTEFPDSIRSRVDLKAFQSFAIGVSAGYAHSFVMEKFFINLAAIPGFGYQRIQTTALSDGSVVIENQPAGQILLRTSLGYEHPKFFLGLFGSVNFRNLELDPYDFQLSTGQFRFMAGKRFNVARKK